MLGSLRIWQLLLIIAAATCLGSFPLSTVVHAQEATPAPVPATAGQPSVALPSGPDAPLATEEEAPLPIPTEVSDENDRVEIVVRGINERISSWKRAETEHVIIYSNGSEKNLRKAALQIDQLHYLLSFIFGRLDAPDTTQKLRITLIGDVDFMDSMKLVNWRSSEGPFAGPVQNQRYYDPRIDGAIMAVSREDLYFSAAIGSVAGQGNDFFTGAGGNIFSDPGFSDDGFDDDGFGDSGFNDDPGPPDFIDTNDGDQTRPWEQALFAGYAQHYITTHLTAAYPRWYIDAVGALFSTVRINDDGAIEYGRSPPAFRGLYNNSEKIDIGALLAAGEAGPGEVWSSHQAWMVAHFFFLSSEKPQRKQQLAQYIGAIANGFAASDAVRVFGDLKALQKELNAYGARRTRFATVPLTDVEFAEPDIRSLGVSQAALLKKQVEIDARLTLPPLPASTATSTEAEQAQKQRERAIALRDQWIGDLRESAKAQPANLAAWLLLAQAECRLANFVACNAAADQVLMDEPNDLSAMSWKSIALVNQAVASASENREEQIREGRALAVAANRSDPDAVLPLIAYFRSFTDAGLTAPEPALRGMLKVIDTVPNAPESRLMIAQELQRQGRREAADSIALPLKGGPWNSPERELAVQDQT